MAQQPAVILIARHGARLDISDQSWHLSTPTPYDPPITYGGWNQSRSLGVRIASLLDAREQEFSSGRDADSQKQEGDVSFEERPRKRRRLKHKVVIHTSPFLRCLQTSIAIAAGMAQYNPSIEAGNTRRRPSSLSPRLRATEGHGTMSGLSSIAEPKHDLAHAIALKSLNEHRRHRKSKLRVDAFLGEWLNPSYFEGITAPPPSSMMVTTAKAELMENESVEIFQSAPAARPAGNNLWGAANATTNASRESTLDDWSALEAALPKSPGRSRANTETNASDSESGRKSPFKPGSTLQPLTSALPKQEPSVYTPPTPHYAVSPAQQIPRGYVAHARNACTDVDYQWDSSRPPEAWGDGGEDGEEWSAMHKRLRKGLNRLVRYYSQEEVDERSEGAPEIGQLEDYDRDEVQEDLVVVLVTHGAGCNALIGALTGQPVLLDVGMASLTMAVRRDDAPLFTAQSSTDGKFGRRRSTDVGLSTVYEMKFVSSTEHLRPGANPMRTASALGRSTTLFQDPFSTLRERGEHPRSNTNSSLGSIRRPSAVNNGIATSKVPNGSSSVRREGSASPVPTVSAGLWTPPASRTPVMPPQRSFLPLTDHSRDGAAATADVTAIDFGTLPPTSVPVGTRETTKKSPLAVASEGVEIDSDNGANLDSYDSDTADGLPKPGDSVPSYLIRRLSQEGLWGSGPTGAQVERTIREPKRRWTVEQD